MKHATLLIVSLLAMASSAQEWAPVGASWNYAFSIPIPSPASGYVHFEVIGDTLINGQTTRKIARSTYYYEHISQQYGSYEMQPIFSHASDGIVWIYVPAVAAFDTLYDLNAVPGDHWDLAPMPEPVACEDQSRMTVIDTGTIVIDNFLLHWLAVDVHYIDDFGDDHFLQDSIIERIGSTGYYMLPHDHCNGFIDGAEGGGLFCYNDADIDYQSPFFSDCVFGLGIGSISSTKSITLYPNPGQDDFELFIPVYFNGVICIHDAVGRIIHETPVSGSIIHFDARHWPSGLYTVRLLSDQGRPVFSTWIKR